MDLGAKIKALRTDASMTQEELASKLEVTPQAVSKWENNTCAPDIYMLPKLSVEFGVTIDELFDLTIDERLHRIENLLDMETTLTDRTFQDTKEFLFDQLSTYPVKGRIESFIAHLYHHRMQSDAVVVSRYARESMQKKPDVKDAQWLLQMSEGAAVTDWNARQHNKTILFYKEQVENFPDVSRNYLELMDNLLMDYRTKEAREILERYQKVEGHQERQVLVYEARIAVREGNFALADQWIKILLERFPEDSGALFEAAGFYADRCDYDKALELFEKSYTLSAKPRYSDELLAESIIYEIRGEYGKAIEALKRVLENLGNEWGFTEGAPVISVTEEIRRLQGYLK